MSIKTSLQAEGFGGANQHFNRFCNNDSHDNLCCFDFPIVEKVNCLARLSSMLESQDGSRQNISQPTSSSGSLVIRFVIDREGGEAKLLSI